MGLRKTKIVWAIAVCLVVLAVTGLEVQSHFIGKRNERVVVSCSRPDILVACRELLAARDAKFGTNKVVTATLLATDVPNALLTLRGLHPDSIVVKRDHVLMKFGALAPVVVRAFKDGAEEFGDRELSDHVWMSSP